MSLFPQKSTHINFAQFQWSSSWLSDSIHHWPKLISGGGKWWRLCFDKVPDLIFQYFTFFFNNTLTCGVINININININRFFPQTITTLFNTYVQRSLGERGGKLGWDGVCRSPPHHFHHPGWWAKTLRKAFLSLNDLWTKWLSLYHWTFAQFHFPSPKQYVFPGFFSPRPNIQLTDHDMHLSHWHYSRRWCWGRGLLPIHSRGKGKCYKQTIRFKVCKGSPKIFPPKPVNSPSLKNILFRFCQRWFPPFQYILLNIKLLSLYFENTSKDGPKKYSFSKSYNMGSSIPA